MVSIVWMWGLLSRTTPRVRNFLPIGVRCLSGAPIRHPIPWTSPDFYDKEALEVETRRVFDVCHGCRRCFNLCNSFPLLFDAIDNSPTGELDSVPSREFAAVADDCTLCDMCYLTKCPYVPPHEFNIDFPHLIIRHRAVGNIQSNKHYSRRFAEQSSQQSQQDLAGFRGKGPGDKIHVLPDIDRSLLLSASPPIQTVLGKTDLVGNAVVVGATFLNGLLEGRSFWGKRLRQMMENVGSIHRHAYLLPYVSRMSQFTRRLLPQNTSSPPRTQNPDSPGATRKVALLATCLVQYNEPNIGLSLQGILHHAGFETKVIYEGCCGMPQWEQGLVGEVCAMNMKSATALENALDDGYDLVGMTPSCVLMWKHLLPLLLPNHTGIARIAGALKDGPEYLVHLHKQGQLPGDREPLPAAVMLHHACHARAQNIGHKAREMLQLIPGIQLQVMEKCSGHGGKWGVMKDNLATALQVGKPVAKKAVSAALKEPVALGELPTSYLASECHLAGLHIQQGMSLLNITSAERMSRPVHPMELLAMSYGLVEGQRLEGYTPSPAESERVIGPMPFKMAVDVKRRYPEAKVLVVEDSGNIYALSREEVERQLKFKSATEQ